jgi:O-acetylhomoserine (thiol)-lyase
MPAITASPSPRSSGRRPSSCGRAPRGCAILASNPAVAWVNHPSLQSHPDHALAQRLLPKGAGSIVSFGIKGGRAAGKAFIDSLKLVSHLANVGDAKTLVIHPASTTHQQLDAASLAASGIGEDMIRLSVGLEEAGDITDDLAQALRASQKLAAPAKAAE